MNSDPVRWRSCRRPSSASRSGDEARSHLVLLPPQLVVRLPLRVEPLPPPSTADPFATAPAGQTLIASETLVSRNFSRFLFPMTKVLFILSAVVILVASFFAYQNGREFASVRVSKSSDIKAPCHQDRAGR
jgi:hypothetical protein